MNQNIEGTDQALRANAEGTARSLRNTVQSRAKSRGPSLLGAGLQAVGGVYDAYKDTLKVKTRLDE